jgi:hypothetical protein
MITFVKDKCFGLVNIGQERTTTVGHEGEILEILSPTIQNFFLGALISREGDCGAPKLFDSYCDRYRHDSEANV